VVAVRLCCGGCAWAGVGRHLFPKDYLETKLGVKEVRRASQIANFVLVEWSDIIDISSEALGVAVVLHSGYAA